MTATTEAAPQAGSGRTAKTLAATGVGNALEWFDWSIYATFASFFASQFFDPGDPLSAFLSTMAVFAVGFLARPLGGFLFGWLADRRGRKFSMCATVALAAAGSLVIGLAPSYAMTGVLASALLLLARLAQGLAHGGEMPAAQTYVSEAAPAHRRGRWSSLIYVSGTIGALGGLLLGAVLTSALSKADMAAYGWRIPFLIGGLGGLVALLMRAGMHETEAFRRSENQARERSARSMWREVAHHRKQAAQVIGLTVGLTVTYYVWAVATPAYAMAALGVDSNAAMVAGLAAGAVFVVMLPLWGALSDRVGRKPVLLTSTLGSAAAVFPASAALQDSAWQLFLSMVAVQVFLAGGAAIVPAVYAELFPTGIRTVGVGIPYSVAVAVFGGTAPYLQTWIGEHGGRGVFNGYVVVLLLISAFVCARLPETRGKVL